MTKNKDSLKTNEVSNLNAELTDVGSYTLPFSYADLHLMCYCGDVNI